MRISAKYSRNKLYNQSEPLFQEAISRIREIIADHDPNGQLLMATVLTTAGMQYMEMQQPEKAEAVLLQSLPLLRSLAARDPAGYRRSVAMVLASLTQIYLGTERRAQAVTAGEEALSIWKELQPTDPEALGRYIEQMRKMLNKDKM